MSTNALIPELQDIYDALLEANLKLSTQQQQYATLQASDAQLAAKYGVDEQTIQQLRATMASVPPNLLSLLPTGAPVTAVTGMHTLPFVADPNARPLLQWFQPGPSGNSTPKPTDPHGTWTTTIAGNMRTITFTPAGPYNNAIFPINVVKGDTLATKYAQLVTFELPDAALTFCQGIETNWEHSLGGFRFNQGTQLLLQGGQSPQVRFFDIAAQAWVSLSKIPFPPLGTGKPVTIINEVQRVPGGMTFVALWLNGVRYPVNVTTKAVPTTWASYLQGAVQMDVTGAGKGYSLNLRDAQAVWG